MKVWACSFWLLMTLGISGPLMAQSAPTPCQNMHGQPDYNMCAAYRYQLADDTLNLVWKQLVREVPKDIAARTKSAQLHWIALRDEHCALLRDSYGIGSGASEGYADCLRAMTEQRTAELREVLEWFGHRDE